jgi:hypothetical protein
MANPRDVSKWDSLSPAYRARLERNGIGRAAYLRGDSLKTARGKKPGQTPEHPKDAIKNPERYKGYKPKVPRWKGTPTPQDRSRLETQAVRAIDQKLGNRIKYNPLTVRLNVPRMTIAELLFVISADAEDIADRGSDVMHPVRKSNNPFYYH